MSTTPSCPTPRWSTAGPASSTPPRCATTRRIRGSTRTCGSCSMWASRWPRRWAINISRCSKPARPTSRATSPRIFLNATSNRYSWRSNMRGILLLAAATAFAQPKAVTVAADSSGDFTTVAAAIESGAKVIRIKPGSYRELLNIPQSGIQLRGAGARPEDVVLTYDNSAGTAGGTTKSASITVSGDDFYAENLTIENSSSRTRPLKQEGSQAVALQITRRPAGFLQGGLLGYHETRYDH